MGSGTYVDIASGALPTPDAPWHTLHTRFDTVTAQANDMLTLLVGEDGQSGYLGEMNAVIQSAPAVSIPAPGVDTGAVLQVSGLEIPVFNNASLGSFPEESYPVPSLLTLPTIDTDALGGIAPPTPIDATFTWAEEDPVTSLYDALLARMLSDLQTGATGLDPVAEQAIYDRAKSRQQTDREKEYTTLNATLAGRQFMLPSGALVSALTDFSIAANRQDADIENQIIITQAELAQKNSQFCLQQSIVLEQLLRQAAGERSARDLEYKRIRVDALVRDYSERMRGYVSELEGQKIYIEAQAEALRGAIATNTARVDLYEQQYKALAVRINGVSSRNESLVRTFVGEVQAYSEAERAVATRNESTVKLIEAKVAAAELDLKAAIASAEHAISGYATETSLKEKISSDMAHIAAQSVASFAGAVNAGVSIGYNAGESKTETWSHGESLHETHGYEHPVA